MTTTVDDGMVERARVALRQHSDRVPDREAMRHALAAAMSAAPDLATVLVAVTLPLAPWNGDAQELRASVEARLNEVYGDDGGAYVPLQDAHVTS
jgi:hypothetical protein